MAESFNSRAQRIGHRAKVKTGCATCRIRKIKCDEKKPFCQRCVSTGRTCDGYDSRFKPFLGPLVNNAILSAELSKSYSRSHLSLPSSNEVSDRDIELLCRYFSTKTLFDVDLGCVEEAKQVLQASLTNVPVRHAVSSLRALRDDLETSGDDSASGVRQTPGQYYGLQQYSIALRALASQLSVPSSDTLKSTLLCCQTLISIEQVRKNYSAMINHLIRGLEIMREHRARPTLSRANEVVRAHSSQLPLLDVFVIKLFAAPCKFADPTEKVNVSSTISSSYPIPRDGCSLEPRKPRTIAPNMRAKLTNIASSTLKFLNKVSYVESAEIVLLQSERAALLDTLEEWLSDIVRARSEMMPLDFESISISFMRMFYLILKTILLGTLDGSFSLRAELMVENERLLEVADKLTGRLKSYSLYSSPTMSN